MTDEQQKLKYEDLVYIGKDLTKVFKNEGEPDVKGYKYKFKADMNDKFSRDFWGTEKTKGVDYLEEGKVICIGFIEKPNPNDSTGTKPMKHARFFGEPRASETGQTVQPVQQNLNSVQTTASDNSAPNVPLNAVNDHAQFKADYKVKYLMNGIAQPDVPKYNADHFALSYLASKNENLLPLIKQLKEEFNK